MPKYALISVYDKTGIIDFARELHNLGYEIISSSGTAKALKTNNIKVTEVSEVTGFPEIMNGRIKTLHPKIHAGLLALRDNLHHLKQLKDNKINLIDIIVVNLYPFETVVKKGGSLEEIIENIDIGGPAMIRAAAKNYRFVTVIADPNDYQKVLIELKKGDISLTTKKTLALKAYHHTAFYDSVIASVLNNQFNIKEKFPDEMTIGVRKNALLRYGENPHQQAALYTSALTEGINLSESEIIQGKEMSYNNYLDAEAALNLIKEFSTTTAVIIKHHNPCGIASASTLVKAYKTALFLDPKSAFGGIVAFNKKVDDMTAKELTKTFLEVIIAPDYSQSALKILAIKQNLRVVKVKNFHKDFADTDYRLISGGLLVQNKDNRLYQQLKVVSKRKPTKKELADLIFAFKVVKQVKSNAVVLAKNQKSVGIGPGQTSRVDSLKIAVMKAQEFKIPIKGAVLASEAFFPFRDSIDQAAKYGVKAIIQPGGSKADVEVIKAVDEYGMAMVFTGMRHFKH